MPVFLFLIMTARKVKITVIGDNIAKPKSYEAARQVGEAIAEPGFVTITGGSGGIMESANRRALESGGLSIGILPGKSFDQTGKYGNVVVPTVPNYSRNTITAQERNAVVAVLDDVGTLSKICFGWIHSKLIFE